MSVVIAVPVFRVGCKVGIDRGRAWSVIDEVILWAIARQSKTLASLANDADLPRQVIVASIARLMRFRLVEVAINGNDVAFQASEYGSKLLSSGAPLPFFPKRISRRISFVIEWATGDFFPTRQIRLMNRHKIDEVRRSGTEVRVVSVDGEGPSMSHEANLSRLSDIAARGWDEQVAWVDGRTATLRDDEYMALHVIDGEPQGFPESAGEQLRRIVGEVAALPPGTRAISVPYVGARESSDDCSTGHPCSIDTSDIVIGGSSQRECLERLLSLSHRRVVVHSTFLDVARFKDVVNPIRAACARGVAFDLLWGAEKDEDTERRNADSASRIAAIVRDDPDLRGRFRVHMRTTGSHAKLILLDTAEGLWIAGVGSCNWFSSPFQAVELSVVLRDQHVVADIALALQRLVGRRGLSDDIATEMAINARNMRSRPSEGGVATVTVVVGAGHDRLIRTASSEAKHRFVVGSNRLGSTARPGALMQGEVAASREGVKATVLYTQTSGPLKNRHARLLEEEARANGVLLRRTKKIPLHGKFVAWDNDDLVVTSLNWASASADPGFPWGEMGVHINTPGVAEDTLARLGAIFPELTDTGSAVQDADG